MQRQSKSHPPSHARKISRGRPAFADSQRQKILELLRAAGPRGVSREELIFGYRWTQCGTRVFELEGMGYKIRHESRPRERLVFYVLESEPLKQQPIPTGADCYGQEHDKWPASHRYKKPLSDERLANPDCFVLTPPEPRQ
jgi:hypothetical protein